MIAAPLILIVAIIFIALVFDFTNGFHDLANSISTVVSTKVLSPGTLCCSRLFLIFLRHSVLGWRWQTPSAISWNSISLHHDYSLYRSRCADRRHQLELITWFFGLPTSSSHALIGGSPAPASLRQDLPPLNGRLLVRSRFLWISPMIGLVCGFLFMAAILWLTRKSNKPTTEVHFKRLQLCSAAAYTSATGQTMPRRRWGSSSRSSFQSVLQRGCQYQPPAVPFWVIIICYTTIALGTLSGGGGS